MSQDTGPVGIRVGRVKTDMRKRMRAEMMEQGIEGSNVDEADLDARVNEVFKKAPLPEHPGDPVFAPYTGPRGIEVALLESAPVRFPSLYYCCSYMLLIVVVSTAASRCTSSQHEQDSCTFSQEASEFSKFFLSAANADVVRLDRLSQGLPEHIKSIR